MFPSLTPPENQLQSDDNETAREEWFSTGIDWSLPV